MEGEWCSTISAEGGYRAESAWAQSLKCAGSPLPAEIPKDNETYKIHHMAYERFLAPIFSEVCEVSWILNENSLVVQCFWRKFIRKVF